MKILKSENAHVTTDKHLGEILTKGCMNVTGETWVWEPPLVGGAGFSFYENRYR